MISLPGMPKDNEDEENSNDGSTSDSSESNEKHSDNDIFKGQILHSSQLDELESSDLEGKTIVVVGSGASGVEAVETALAKGAKHTVMLARDDKVSHGHFCQVARTNTYVFSGSYQGI